MDDQITLENMIFFGTHGVNVEEKELGQRFGLDLTLWLDLEQATTSDNLADTVSYSAIYKLVKAEMEGTPSKLLEHLAARILQKVFGADKRVKKVSVKISKLSPPLKGSTTGGVSVTLERPRAWYTK